jgi:16S rRNA (uracil1498-N3)-methyltransferase
MQAGGGCRGACCSNGDPIPGDPGIPDDPGIPGIPPNCAAAGPSGKAASTRANENARQNVIALCPGFAIRPGSMPGTAVSTHPETGNNKGCHNPSGAMSRYDFRTPRLFIDALLDVGARIALDASQANYLGNVLRLEAGDSVLVFNGRDGEWRGELGSAGKRSLALTIAERTRPQTGALDLHYLFAPLKHARLDYMVQKAVEMGASRLQPILTRHAQVARINLERMQANAVEAAEQCGILTLPEIGAPLGFDAMIAQRDPARLLVFCDEDAEVQDPVAALAQAGTGRAGGIAVLIGPEGGFAAEERAALLKLPNTVRLALGPRILRADTAAVAALALVGAVLGDWRSDPRARA